MNYEWKNFDYADPDLKPWLTDHVPDIPRAALVQSETRPRCDRYEEGLILNLRGVNLNADQSVDDMVSVRLWVTEALVVSVRMRRIFALAAVAEAPPDRPGGFVCALVTELTDRIEHEILDLIERTDNLEERVLADAPMDGAQMSALRHSAIKLRRYIAPQKDALLKLATIEMPFLKKSDQHVLREDANRMMLALEALDAVRDRIGALLGQIETRSAQQQAWHGYVLSLVAAIFLPLGFLTGVFGMNVAGLPGTEWSGAFVALVVAMGFVAVGLLVLFRWLKWV